MESAYGIDLAYLHLESFDSKTFALADVALDKVKREAETKAARARAQDKLSWDDLILPAETKEDLQTYCEILRRHEHYAVQGIHVPRGLLFRRTTRDR